jgi:hypothetical protein
VIAADQWSGNNSGVRIKKYEAVRPHAKLAVIIRTMTNAVAKPAPLACHCSGEDHIPARL